MSKIIDFPTMQIIVENAMRKNGLGGTQSINGNQISIENGWKETLTANNQTFENPQNLQKMRDMVAQAILDALTASGASGSISSGNTSGNPSVVSTSNVIINGDSSAPKAARVTDKTVVDLTSDAGMIAWMKAVDAFLSAASSIPTLAAANGAYSTAKAAILAAGGTVPPNTVTSKITTGSSTVQIGN